MRQNGSRENSPEILVFGGTVEGRAVSDFLTAEKITHTVCVATGYGEEVLKKNRYVSVHQGRMDEEEMRRFMKEKQYLAVVDATHPYAVEVSRNIREACRRETLPYLRFLRAASPAEESGETGEVNSSETGEITYVSSAREAAGYLEEQQGRIFLTTGSKELHVFTETISDRSRIFARVLPVAHVLEEARALGLEGKQLCAMQGPFSREINTAMLRQTKADFLVTKDTGVSGGFPEKMAAVKSLGIRAVVIRRPGETGCGWEELTGRLRKLSKEWKASQKTDDGRRGRQICCIGIGMGGLDTMTHEAADAIRRADILFGAPRMLQGVQREFRFGAAAPAMEAEYEGEKIAAYLNRHPEYENAVILMSGDVGFYSGARSVEKAFAGEELRYICGISSVVYFAARVGVPWQDAKLVSAHGRKLSLLNYVNRYRKLILLVSGAADVERFCLELEQAGMDHLRVTVGTNLSSDHETVTAGRPADYIPCRTEGLHIMMVENEGAHRLISCGISDDDFVRGKVPMTKEEIRILSVAKLHLTEDAVVYDVGAGTGSVSVEIGRLCTEGCVYAVERNPEGVGLIRENSRRHGVSNVISVEGAAPAALETLPPPTHAFIGGTSGNMREILRVLFRKNPAVRIVINTIALESIAAVMGLLKEFEIREPEIVHVAAAKSKTLGHYHMMQALNPVYIISFGGT